MRHLAPSPLAPAPALPRSRWALASLSLSMLLSALGTSIANVGLPTLAEAFGASFQQVQWVVLAYLLAITTLIVSAGRLGDLVGRKRLLLAGIALFTLASALCSLAPTLGLLVAARAAQGLGAALMMALTMASVADAVPKARAGSGMGLLGTMSAVGTALGPTLGGILIAGHGWQLMFLVNVPLGALALLLVHRFVPAEPLRPDQGERLRFDHLGTVLLAGTLASYALAMTLGRGRFGPLNVALLLVALLGTGLFLRVESKAASPLIRLAMFRHPALGSGFAASALVSSVVMATLVVGPFYLSGALALDAVAIGLVMSTGPLVAALVGVPAGRAVDRFGPHRVGVSGLVAMAAGAAVLPFLATASGVPGYVASLATLTAGYGLFQAANNTAIMQNVHASQRGVAGALVNLSRNLGLITGASFMGGVFAWGAGATDLATTRPGALATGLHWTFAVALALVLIALALGWVARRRAAAALRPVA
ncbi:MAG: MFS transporter [Hydrogenophaga sp.]|uniref:MFS transporter n=1 Tax=Hydrogenophaga sp. TaxID=1904254 RepID=UPI0026022C4D|nr:MFS transporter [Hydrogenophaga sp.]MCW5653429.1 MFS transporter [Hydrogenophaga sp.]MCW5672419.1 MFS transporter [Hydrogenophaga sp.]